MSHHGRQGQQKNSRRPRSMSKELKPKEDNSSDHRSRSVGVSAGKKVTEFYPTNGADFSHGATGGTARHHNPGAAQPRQPRPDDRYNNAGTPPKPPSPKKEVAEEIMNRRITTLLKHTDIKEEYGIKRKYYGVVNRDLPEKVIILLGASGSGKTTLLNFIANCIRGVKSVDDPLVHVELTGEDICTDSITAYTFCQSPNDVPVTIIDTPGFDDSLGAKVQDRVQDLKTFLDNASSENLEINAIGFVAQAHLVRLTASEQLVMDYVLNVFGETATDRLITFVTFADNQPTPPLVEAMRRFGITSKMFLKFNNAILNARTCQEIDDMDRVCWRIGSKSWSKCWKYLLDLPQLQVKIEKSIQEERYDKGVVQTAEQELKSEIKSFINHYEETRLTKEINESQEKVWKLATVVERLKWTNEGINASTEEILVAFVKDVCQSNPRHIIKVLSLSASRHLWVSCVSLVKAFAQIYKFAFESKSNAMRDDGIHYTLYCSKCTHYCPQCQCLLSHHENLPPSRKSELGVLNPDDLLRESKLLFQENVREFSIPGFEPSEQELLECLHDARINGGKMFIDHLIKELDYLGSNL